MDSQKQNITSTYKNLIKFVPQQITTTATVLEKNDKKNSDKLTGEDVKRFYESLLQDRSTITSSLANNLVNKNSTPKHSSVVKRKKKRYVENKPKKYANLNNIKTSGHPHSTSMQKKDTKLLQFAQNGDIEELRQLAGSDVDIDVTDMFDWTPLMCAVQSGHHDCVRVCLEFGANRDLRNKSGNSAWDIAIAAGHHDIAATISSFRPTDNEHFVVKTESSPFWCEVCKMTFSSSEGLTHESSTLHLFNSGRKPAPSSYLIPESNPGFQMLLRSGWDVDRGLGPRGDGKKYPVKTVLKRDREGLGGSSTSGKKQTKVTHFGPNDVKAVSQNKVNGQRQMTVRTLAKRSQNASERRAKRWERSIRDEFR